MTITLDHNKQTAKITSVDKQVVYINKLGFLTNDENWVDRIFSSSLTIQSSKNPLPNNRIFKLPL